MEAVRGAPARAPLAPLAPLTPLAPLAPAPQALPRLAPLCAPGAAGALPEVYEPAEDTFLFVDTLYADKAALNARRPVVCLEVG
jgi:hypothetical protein